MKMPVQVSIVMVALALSLTLNPAALADTYTYDAAGRLIGVVYDDGSSITYSYDANGNLLGSVAEPVDVLPPNESPDVIIVEGSITVGDTDGLAGESVNLSATATDSDGTVESTEWLINDEIVASGLAPTIDLPDGSTEIIFRATDNDGATSTTSVTIMVEAPPLEEGWPVPYSGVSPAESLGLGFNNVSALNPDDGLIYSCLRVLVNGEQSDLDGIEEFDIAFQILSVAEGTIQVAKVKPFNATGALNEDGELPGCSGSIEMTTGIYSDFIVAGIDVFSVEFELIDGDNLVLRLNSLEFIGNNL